MSIYYFTEGDGFSSIAINPIGFVDLPGEVCAIHRYASRVWVLVDHKPHRCVFWRKRGLHWLEIDMDLLKARLK